MLKVTVELYPFGYSDNKREIASFYIANDSTGSIKNGNYLFRKTKEEPWQGSIQHWDRSKPVELLVQAVIEKHYGTNKV